MKRRANGEGTRIVQRPDGRWWSRLRYIDPITGISKREAVYGRTQTEVRDKMNALKARIARGDGPIERIGFQDFMTRWLADVAKPSLKPATYALYEGIVRNHLVPTFGNRALADIRTAAIAHTIAGERSKLTPRVAQSALTVLRTAFETAIAWRLLERNSAVGVVPPRTEPDEIRPLAPDQVLVFLKAAKSDPLYSLFLLAIFTQLREGELLALRVADEHRDDDAHEVLVHRCQHAAPARANGVSYQKKRPAMRALSLHADRRYPRDGVGVASPMTPLMLVMKRCFASTGMNADSGL